MPMSCMRFSAPGERLPAASSLNGLKRGKAVSWSEAARARTQCSGILQSLGGYRLEYRLDERVSLACGQSQKSAPSEDWRLHIQRSRHSRLGANQRRASSVLQRRKTAKGFQEQKINRQSRGTVYTTRRSHEFTSTHRRILNKPNLCQVEF